MSERIPVAVVGCGRMGRLHARVYSQMPTVELVGVYDASADAAEETTKEYGGRAFKSVEEMVAAKVKAVTIAVPTTHHLKIGSQFLEAGIACLIEKPLAPNSDEARQLVSIAARNHAVLQVGHIERFNPAVRSLLELDIVPGFLEVIRISPLSFRSIDVGVVLDMMIHDIDIVLQLARSPIKSIDSVGVNVIGEHEDICNARIRFTNGCVANLTASRLSLKTERKLRAFSSDTYVSLDYQKKYGLAIKKGNHVNEIRDIVNKIKSGQIQDLSDVNYTDLVDVQELAIDDVEPLRAELDAFVDSVVHRKPPIVSGEDGLSAVEVAEKIVAAMTRGAV